MLKNYNYVIFQWYLFSDKYYQHLFLHDSVKFMRQKFIA